VVFERFAASFTLLPADQKPSTPFEDPDLLGVRGYRELASRFAGCGFDGGLYRVHSNQTGRLGRQLAAEAFPEYAGRARPFGYDWLGRQFAIDLARVEDGEPLVLMLEPGTGQALEIPTTFVEFHDAELVDEADAALAADFFEQWRSLHPDTIPLDPNACVGYRVPLFMGGADETDNLEVNDLDVYWTLFGQLRAKAFPVRPFPSTS
jgi:Domain of unknown function (DUF1851)